MKKLLTNLQLHDAENAHHWQKICVGALRKMEVVDCSLHAAD
jgi:hypothetical protein